MKIYVDPEEWYPVYELRDNAPTQTDESVELPSPVVEAYQDAMRKFRKAQRVLRQELEDADYFLMKK